MIIVSIQKHSGKTDFLCNPRYMWIWVNFRIWSVFVSLFVNKEYSYLLHKMKTRYTFLYSTVSRRECCYFSCAHLGSYNFLFALYFTHNGIWYHITKFISMYLIFPLSSHIRPLLFLIQSSKSSAFFLCNHLEPLRNQSICSFMYLWYNIE